MVMFFDSFDYRAFLVKHNVDHQALVIWLSVGLRLFRLGRAGEVERGTKCA